MLAGVETRAFEPGDRRRALAWLVEGRDADLERLVHAIEELYRRAGLEPPEAIGSP